MLEYAWKAKKKWHCLYLPHVLLFDYFAAHCSVYYIETRGVQRCRCWASNPPILPLRAPHARQGRWLITVLMQYIYSLSVLVYERVPMWHGFIIHPHRHLIPFLHGYGSYDASSEGAGWRRRCGWPSSRHWLPGNSGGCSTLHLKEVFWRQSCVTILMPRGHMIDTDRHSVPCGTSDLKRLAVTELWNSVAHINNIKSFSSKCLK